MRLTVHADQSRVGWLIGDSLATQFEFIYDDEWVASPEGFPLSPSLPLVSVDQTREAHSLAVKIFFENLLPEGKALEDAAMMCRISKNNVAGLLAVLGKETAGALRIVPDTADVSPADPAPALRHLPRGELSLRIQERMAIPFAVWDQRVRFSIAGHQDKLAVYQDGHGEWFLADAAHLASTHILKPEPLNPLMAGLTSNEFICMRLAKAVGLAVAPVELHHIPDPVLLITRFDRVQSDGEVIRLPAIDGCQALGLPAIAKYERPFGYRGDVQDIRAGASLGRLFQLLNKTARPAAEKISLLRWAIFQVLIGNLDAHAKNLTFLCSAGGLSLAPAYDLVSSILYADAQVQDSYAMAVGDAFRPSEMSANEWATFCYATGLKLGLVKRELITLASKTKDALPRVLVECCAEGAHEEVAAKIEAYVLNESARQLEMAALTQSSKFDDLAKVREETSLDDLRHLGSDDIQTGTSNGRAR